MVEQSWLNGTPCINVFKKKKKKDKLYERDETTFYVFSCLDVVVALFITSVRRFMETDLRVLMEFEDIMEKRQRKNHRCMCSIDQGLFLSGL